ncbi:hypothetical protein KW782_02265 [Candidatus Parcubacteria bacterium]|nr:hypothetical protein [Candidatus Parcubacteria bacterium]
MNTVIAYIPALHQGYITFFKKYPGTLYILGHDLIHEQPRMDRDIRALDPQDIKRAIEVLNLFTRVEILTVKNSAYLVKARNIVMPDEDLSHLIAKKYFKNKRVKFVSTFLRWDRHTALKDSTKPSSDRIISEKVLDKEMMAEAYEQAKKSSDWWRNIGALVTRDNKILLTGFNRPLPSDHVHNVFGDPRSNFDYGVSFELSKFLHAEASIIAQAAKKGISLDGTTLYVTTFPCPVCAKSVAVSGIKKVYYSEGYSLLDAEDILKGAGIEIIQVKMN